MVGPLMEPRAPLVDDEPRRNLTLIRASTSRQLDSDHKKAWLRRQHMEHEQSLARRRSVDLDAAPSIVAAFPAANASMRQAVSSFCERGVQNCCDASWIWRTFSCEPRV